MPTLPPARPPRAWLLHCTCWALPPPPRPRQAASRPPPAAAGRGRRPKDTAWRGRSICNRCSSSSNGSTPAISPEERPVAGAVAVAGVGCIIRVGAKALPPRGRTSSRRCCGRGTRAIPARRRGAAAAAAGVAVTGAATAERRRHRPRSTLTSGMSPRGAATATATVRTKVRGTRPRRELPWSASTPLGSWPRVRDARRHGGWSASTTGRRRCRGLVPRRRDSQRPNTRPDSEKEGKERRRREKERGLVRADKRPAVVQTVAACFRRLRGRGGGTGTERVLAVGVRYG